MTVLPELRQIPRMGQGTGCIRRAQTPVEHDRQDLWWSSKAHTMEAHPGAGEQSIKNKEPRLETACSWPLPLGITQSDSVEEEWSRKLTSAYLWETWNSKQSLVPSAAFWLGVSTCLLLHALLPPQDELSSCAAAEIPCRFKFAPGIFCRCDEYDSFSFQTFSSHFFPLPCLLFPFLSSTVPHSLSTRHMAHDGD